MLNHVRECPKVPPELKATIVLEIRDVTEAAGLVFKEKLEPKAGEEGRRNHREDTKSSLVDQKEEIY